jgi:hypothetical protein
VLPTYLGDQQNAYPDNRRTISGRTGETRNMPAAKRGVVIDIGLEAKRK